MIALLFISENDCESVLNELFLGTQKEGANPPFLEFPKIVYREANSRLAMGDCESVLNELFLGTQKGEERSILSVCEHLRLAV